MIKLIYMNGTLILMEHAGVNIQELAATGVAKVTEGVKYPYLVILLSTKRQKK